MALALRVEFRTAPLPNGRVAAIAAGLVAKWHTFNLCG